jgi:hypothetical protein
MAENILTKTLKAIDEQWYDAGGILGYYDEATHSARDEHEHSMSDTLALFIVRELCELYDPTADDEQNAREFGNALIKAGQDLEGANSAAQAVYATVGF